MTAYIEQSKFKNKIIVIIEVAYKKYEKYNMAAYIEQSKFKNKIILIKEVAYDKCRKI